MRFSISTFNSQSIKQYVFRRQNARYRVHNSVIMVIQEQKKKSSFNGEQKVRPIFMERKFKGEFHTLIQDLKLFDLEYFFKQF